MRLCLDAAFNNVGASIFDDKDQLVAVRHIGIVKALPKKPLKDDRIMLIKSTGDDFYNAQLMAKQIARIIKQFDIDYLVVERLAGSQRARAAKLLGMTWGGIAWLISVIEILTDREFHYCYVTAYEVKSIMCGQSKNVPKDAVMTAAKKLYPAHKFPATKNYSEHILDSIGVDEAYKKVRRYRGSNIK